MYQILSSCRILRVLNLHLITKAAKCSGVKEIYMSTSESVLKCTLVTRIQWKRWSEEEIFRCFPSHSGSSITLGFNNNDGLTSYFCLELQAAADTCCRTVLNQKHTWCENRASLEGKSYSRTELNIRATLGVSGQDCEPVFLNVSLYLHLKICEIPWFRGILTDRCCHADAVTVLMLDGLMIYGELWDAPNESWVNVHLSHRISGGAGGPVLIQLSRGLADWVTGLQLNPARSAGRKTTLRDWEEEEETGGWWGLIGLNNGSQ